MEYRKSKRIAILTKEESSIYFDENENVSILNSYSIKNDENRLYILSNDGVKIEGINKIIKYMISNEYMIGFFDLDFKKNMVNNKNLKTFIYELSVIERFNNTYKFKIGAYRDNSIYIGKYISGNEILEKQIICAISLLFINNKKEKIEKIYDDVCDYLDEVVVKSNACGFDKDICEAKRKTGADMGCCHHFKNKVFGIFYEKRPMLCEYQENKRCIAKCITCKMYMCDYMVKKGYKFTCYNIYLLRYYFNFFQKLVITMSFFTKKDKILKLLCIFGY